MKSRSLASPTPARQDLAWPVLALAILALVTQLLSSGRYGYYRDELYFLVCSSHLAWGYVDHAPLVPAVTALIRNTLGDSLLALRLLPAVSNALLVCLAGMLAGRLGGGRRAQLLAALAVLVTPLYLRAHSMLTPAAFETLLWAWCCYLLLRLVQGGNPRLWLLWGLAVGIGLLNKYSFAAYTAAALLGLALTPASRRLLADRWPWLGCLVAALVGLPSLLWQAGHAWPTVEFLRNLGGSVLSNVSRGEFVAGQIFFFNPVAALLWLAGLIWLLRGRESAPYRLFGLAYLLLLGLFALTGGKIYYLAPAYPVLLAAGAVAGERWVASMRPNRLRWSGHRWLPAGFTAALVTIGLLMAPLGLPVLPVTKLDGYCRTLSAGLRGADVLAGHYHDMHGWEELAVSMDSLWADLPTADRQRTFVLAGNYGEAAAIEVLGRPPVVCGHNSYYLWGPPDDRRDVCLAVGLPADRLLPIFGEIELITLLHHEHSAYYESELPVFLCRAPRKPIAEAWPLLKNYR